MEHQPPNPEDRDREVPELEKLYLGEIDMTGVVQQEDSLRDVIGDAIGKADGETRGEIPEWGARTMARALANRLDDPVSGGLHHFAVTGRANKEAIARELITLYNSTTDKEIRDWINRLDTYVINLPEPEALTAQQKPGELQPRDRSPSEGLVEGTPLEKVGAFFDIAFEQADARGEAITAEEARAVASVLSASLLDPNSEMARFADTGDANPVQLHEECQLLKRHQWRTADVGSWIERFEQHLATRTDLGRQTTALPTAEGQSDNPQIEQGVREHGDAFRAYLTLPGVDPHQPDVLKNFQGVHIGTFTSIDQLVNDLTDLPAAMTAIRAAAEGWGLADYVFVDQKKLFAMACESWDIVVHRGTFYVFMK
jgi:hypothetical protein